MEKSNFKEKWHKAVSKRTPKRSDKNENVDKIILSDLIKKQTCPYDLIGRCREDNCHRKHLARNESKIQFYIKNPSKIRSMKHNLEKINAEIDKITGDSSLKPFFTTCLFCLKGMKCNNITSNRFVEIDDNDVKFKVCYPDVSKCDRRITCGFHIDITVIVNSESLRLLNVSFSGINEPSEHYFDNISAPPVQTMGDVNSRELFPSLVDNESNSVSATDASINNEKTDSVSAVNSWASMLTKTVDDSDTVATEVTKEKSAKQVKSNSGVVKMKINKVKKSSSDSEVSSTFASDASVDDRFEKLEGQLHELEENNSWLMKRNIELNDRLKMSILSSRLKKTKDKFVPTRDDFITRSIVDAHMESR